MTNTVRVPIVDKNGRHTHVNKRIDEEESGKKSSSASFKGTGFRGEAFGIEERMNDFFSEGKPKRYGSDDFRGGSFESSAELTKRTIDEWLEELRRKSLGKIDDERRAQIEADTKQLLDIRKSLEDPVWLAKTKLAAESLARGWKLITENVQFRLQKRGCEDFTVKPKRSKLLTAAVATMVAVIGFPLAAQAAASPIGWYNSDDEQRAISVLSYAGIDDPEVRIVTVDNLHVLGQEAKGYVNVLDTEDVIYLRPFDDEANFHDSRRMYTAVVLHEYGHILQKRIIDDMNLSSFERYEKLLELNAILLDGSPNLEDDHGEPHGLLFQGIETNADCILGSLSDVISSAYIDAVEGCEPHGEAMARAVIAGEFPSDKTVIKWEKIVNDEHEAERIQAAIDLEEYIQKNSHHNY